MLRRTAIAVVLLVALAVVLGAAAAVVGVFRVQGTSMAPTLANGDLVLANPLDRAPERFAVAVYDSPQSGAATIKRVIGLPGDRVRIVGATPAAPSGEVQVQPGGAGPWQTVVNAGGAVWPATPHPPLTCCADDGRTTVRAQEALVPAGAYFMLGDNPETSIDSRTQGFVPADKVRATAVLAPIGGSGAGAPRLRAAG